MEKLTIDEIIGHCNREARMYEKACDIKYLETTAMSNLIKEYWEHKQVAEWLEELKSYRASVFGGDMTQKMLKEEYCKAVDDFAESVKNLIVDSSVIRFKDIDEIAEQLKVGDGE